ncbi:isopentenyl-diphosphate Delta-isomerase [Algirhabdus cladophorae]|uniref:isopentenyl-diphosphate Delta-isomerase n=1 Tax=Algirhabdus cladophorae TaxID=3377108 RepID=UPI003B84B215
MTIMIPAWVDGALTPVEKLETHLKGLRHKAVSVFVMDGDKMLIQQRAMHKYHTPGLWANTCCTHPEWDEDPGVCAVRRLDEELGLTGVKPIFRDQIEYRADVGGGLIEHEVVEVFVAEKTPDMTLALNPDEVMATKWISFNDLAVELAQNPEAYTPWLRIYMSEHKDRIFGAPAEA